MTRIILALLAAGPAAAAAPKVTLKAVKNPGSAKLNQAAFLHKGHLYLFGGTRGDDPRDFSPGNFVREGWKLRLADGEVTRLRPPPVPMIRPNCVTAGDAGYAVGGISHDGKKMRLLDTVYRYDFAADAWEKLPVRLPTPRTLCGLAHRGGRLWVFGGWQMDPKAPKRPGPGLTITRQVVTVSLGDRPTLKVLPTPMPRERRSAAGCVLGDRFVLAGGLDDGFDYVLPAAAFEFGKRRFAELPEPARPRAMADMVARGGKLYMAGGFRFGEVPDGGVANPFFPDKSVEVFDPAVGKWRVVLPELPGTPGGSHLRLFARPGGLTAFSGDKTGSRWYIIHIDPDGDTE